MRIDRTHISVNIQTEKENQDWLVLLLNYFWWDLNNFLIQIRIVVRVEVSYH